MKNKQKKFWNCVGCLHAWENDIDKNYKEYPKCKRVFIMDWILEENKEED